MSSKQFDAHQKHFQKLELKLKKEKKLLEHSNSELDGLVKAKQETIEQQNNYIELLNEENVRLRELLANIAGLGENEIKDYLLKLDETFNSIQKKKENSEKIGSFVENYMALSRSLF